jgi:carbamoyltransferase
MKEKLILGINDGHPSTVCLLKNGKVLSCIIEERLIRIKNYSGFPILSIKKIFENNHINPQDIDLIAFSSKDIIPIDLEELGKNKRDTRLGVKAFSLATKLLPMGLTERPVTRIATKMRELLKMIKFKTEYKKMLKNLGLENKDVIFYDHHLTHAASIYCFLKPKNKVLIFTCDGEGDGLCASVNIYEKGKITRKVSIPFVHSIGKMYNEITWHLGLKPWEHEYKVMGLAPYSKDQHTQKTWKIFEGMMSIDKKDKRKFKNNLHAWANSYASYIEKKLYKHRFDSIAYCIQKLTERILTQWIHNNIEHYNIEDIMLSGGVFMNVKANQKILEMDNVNSLFITPSAADESTAIGAAILGYIDLCEIDGAKPKFEEIRDIYFGPDYNENIDDYVKTINRDKFRVENFDDIDGVVGELLTKGKIIARLNGRMEFGARALGNRSILADPRSLDVVRILNEQIKHRDFWMPFAPTILREGIENYLDRPNKKVDDQYMIISFDTKQLGRKELKAAIHQADFTCRPQVLDKSWNEEYYNVIKTFEDITGVGGILNTSFNIHGEPIVCSPADAIHTLENCGLEHLALGNYLITKR